MGGQNAVIPMIARLNGSEKGNVNLIARMED